MEQCFPVCVVEKTRDFPTCCFFFEVSDVLFFFYLMVDEDEGGDGSDDYIDVSYCITTVLIMIHPDIKSLSMFYALQRTALIL